MDLLEGIDLSDYVWDSIPDEHIKLDENLITIRNLISLITDFNDLGFFHRDLKPGNIFVLEDKTSYDKIKMALIDFAFTSDVRYDKRYKGTRKYMPDEMLLREKKSDWYNDTIDVFSTGASIIEILMEHFKTYQDIDFGMLYIIEAMLSYNHCTYSDDEGAFCDNKDHFYNDNFETLEEIQAFIENSEKY